jgi:hypothetical protein
LFNPQDGQLSHIEENIHVLFIIIGVGSSLIILSAIVRHWWRKRKMEEARQRQERDRQASKQIRKESQPACQVMVNL